MKTQDHSYQNLVIALMKSKFPKNNGTNGKHLNIRGTAMRDDLFSMYAKFSKKLTFLIP